MKVKEYKKLAQSLWRNIHSNSYTGKKYKMPNGETWEVDSIGIRLVRRIKRRGPDFYIVGMDGTPGDYEKALEILDGLRYLNEISRIEKNNIIESHMEKDDYKNALLEFVE